MKKSLRRKGFAGQSDDCLVIGLFEGQTVVLFLDREELGLASSLLTDRVHASVDDRGRLRFDFFSPEAGILDQAWPKIQEWAKTHGETITGVYHGMPPWG